MQNNLNKNSDIQKGGNRKINIMSKGGGLNQEKDNEMK